VRNLRLPVDPLTELRDRRCEVRAVNVGARRRAVRARENSSLADR
jgi:hypothetical protein